MLCGEAFTRVDVKQKLCFEEFVGYSPKGSEVSVVLFLLSEADMGIDFGYRYRVATRRCDKLFRRIRGVARCFGAG
jgi:hypothetical protein